MFSRKIGTALALAGAFFLPTPFATAPQQQGQAWAWGFGRNGQLGLGSQSNSSLPQQVKSSNFVDIQAKKSFSAGITPEGKVLTWGKNRGGVLGHLPGNMNLLQPRQIHLNDKVKQVSLGYQSMCVVTDSGQAFIWGHDQKRSTFRSITTVEPEKIEAISSMTKVDLANVQMASCANDYLVLLNKEGRVFSMGDTKVKGSNGNQAKTKTQIIELPLERITKIVSGINFTMALDDQGKVFVWGNNTYGQLGKGGLRNVSEPTLIQALVKEQIVDISAGDNFSGAVTAKGQVYTWGFGNEGQLAHGDKSDQYQPRKVANIKEPIKSISCGGAHTALLTEAGRLLMVGRGRQGQLGREHLDESSSGYTLMVKPVEQLPNAKILKVCCGANHTLVLLENLI